ncbi:MAG TPA: hypothetical protein VM662_08085, partial [Sphingomonas sp.]|nr:hypothetical protein [Sphingomonas sp.]
GAGEGLGEGLGEVGGGEVTIPPPPLPPPPPPPLHAAASAHTDAIAGTVQQRFMIAPQFRQGLASEPPAGQLEYRAFARAIRMN